MRTTSVANRRRRQRRVLGGICVVVVIALICTFSWIRLPKAYTFIARFDGQPVPFPLKTDPTTERFRDGASRDMVSYAFKANPKQVQAAMVEELVANGWTRFENDGGSDDFFRGDFRDSSNKNIPSLGLESITDFATFISDRSMLDVPPEVTCVAIITKKSNLAEIIQRLKQRPKDDGTE
ncbi:MAG TPA: hypothetical protein PKA27_02045 [Fimbriimonadaceae bacterium]|mgnify:CR=1 FL=1|nr:hypothetical protein [Fimbriimonadaceae bacterium]